jgi:hypothetical protein
MIVLLWYLFKAFVLIISSDMAESITEEASRPGFGMRLAIASIGKRFPQARNVSTGWLEGRLHNSQESPDSTSTVTLLVRTYYYSPFLCPRHEMAGGI